MKKPLKPGNRRRVWKELSHLDEPKNMTTYAWQRLKYMARKLDKFPFKNNNNTVRAAKELLRILWEVDSWLELKNSASYYTDAIHFIKDVEDQRNDSRKPLKTLIELNIITAKRLSDGCFFSGLNLRKEYYSARREVFGITKDWQVVNLLNFLHDNKYDYDKAKKDLRASEKELSDLMKEWTELISSLKNPKIE